MNIEREWQHDTDKRVNDSYILDTIQAKNNLGGKKKVEYF